MPVNFEEPAESTVVRYKAALARWPVFPNGTIEAEARDLLADMAMEVEFLRELIRQLDFMRKQRLQR